MIGLKNSLSAKDPPASANTCSSKGCASLPSHASMVTPSTGAGSACGGNISERDDSTLGIEKATNPVFRKSRRDFVAHKLAEKMARPPYFLHLEKVNLLPGRPLKSPLAARVLRVEHPLLVSVLQMVAAGRIAERAGEATLDGQPLFTPQRLEFVPM